MPMQTQRGGAGMATSPLKPGTRRTWLVCTNHRPLYFWKRVVTHCTRGCVGRLGLAWKISPPPIFDSRIVQPVASRCIDYPIRLCEVQRVHIYIKYALIMVFKSPRHGLDTRSDRMRFLVGKAGLWSRSWKEFLGGDGVGRNF
jgi:hypothetical protein